MESLEEKVICTAHTLENGLTVWLNEDHTQPKVLGAVVVKAGAKDCPNTGIAHYFEHMMFKGTDKIGTVDYEKEKEILDRIAAKYDELATVQEASARKALQKQINELSVEAAAYVIPNEFDRLISRYGGTKLNAGTSLDYTVYFNTFSPQYMEQWAEINSERLIHPVFRLFQNELETVYEEKNMYGDYVGGISIERLKERYFAPHPYAYPVIGSTENLKNPRLSEMQRFFEEYYVASNMGLILCGDFQTEEVLPILQRTFSHIRKGEAPKQTPVELPPFEGKERMKLKVPMPFVKMMALGFRGVPANHPDEVALKVAVSLLNNANGTGFLDKLTVEHRVVASMAVNECMNEAGILAIFVVPKLLFQSYSAAEKLVWREIERIKKGEFSEETFQSLKLEQKREYVSALEDMNMRAQVMMRVYSQGKRWEEYLNELKRIDFLTREDVIEVARKYFTRNYLYVTKTTGRYKKDHLPKPDYVPVRPDHLQTQSAYAKALEELPVKSLGPRFIDEASLSITDVALSPFVHFYTTSNPVNDIFSLDIYYGTGLKENPLLAQVASYLHFIGTERESFEVFRNRLQALGSTLMFEASNTNFVVRVTGFDANMVETIALVGSFMQHAQADERKMDQVVDEMKVIERAFFNSSESLAQALVEYATFGSESSYLKKLSLKEFRKLKGEDLVSLFRELQQCACTVHYCGNLPQEKVMKMVTHYFRLSDVSRPSAYPWIRPLQMYDAPHIFFLDMKEISQSIVYGYVRGEAVDDPKERCASKLFSGYFGGDMSSLMFQEIREFRSFAYHVSGKYHLPSFQGKGQLGFFRTLFSTQADKTLDALGVLQSLLEEMPKRPERVEAVKQTLRNEVNNAFPSFRDLSARIAMFRREGFQADPNRKLLEYIAPMTMEDIEHFYERQVAGRPVVYAVVGNARRIDMEKLASFGTVEKVKVKDIYR